jgi:hypothetical protein
MAAVPWARTDWKFCHRSTPCRNSFSLQITQSIRFLMMEKHNRPHAKRKPEWPRKKIEKNSTNLAKAQIFLHFLPLWNKNFSPHSEQYKLYK